MFRNVRLFCQMTGVFSRSSRPFLFALFINNKVHRRVFCGGHDVSELTDLNILLMHKPGFGLLGCAALPVVPSTGRYVMTFDLQSLWKLVMNIFLSHLRR